MGLMNVSWRSVVYVVCLVKQWISYLHVCDVCCFRAAYPLRISCFSSRVSVIDSHITVHIKSIISVWSEGRCARKNRDLLFYCPSDLKHACFFASEEEYPCRYLLSTNWLQMPTVDINQPRNPCAVASTFFIGRLRNYSGFPDNFVSSSYYGTKIHLFRRLWRSWNFAGMDLAGEESRWRNFVCV